MAYAKGARCPRGYNTRRLNAMIVKFCVNTLCGVEREKGAEPIVSELRVTLATVQLGEEHFQNFNARFVGGVVLR